VRLNATAHAGLTPVPPGAAIDGAAGGPVLDLLAEAAR
jgi:hypothetical protein